MEIPNVIWLIPSHDDEDCVNINGERFTLVSWALVADPNGNRIAPVILLDGQPEVLPPGKWRVQVCTSIPVPPAKAPVFN